MRRASSAVLALVALAVVLSIAIGLSSAAVAQDAPDPCPDGFEWIRMSGTSCVQIRAELPPNSHIGYTGNSVCDVGASITEWREAKGPVPGTPNSSFPYLCLCDTYDPAVGDDPEPDAAVRKNCSGLDELVIQDRTRRGLPVPAWALTAGEAPADDETADDGGIIVEDESVMDEGKTDIDGEDASGEEDKIDPITQAAAAGATALLAGGWLVAENVSTRRRREDAGASNVP